MTISFPFGGVNFVLFDTLSKSHCQWNSVNRLAFCDTTVTVPVT